MKLVGFLFIGLSLWNMNAANAERGRGRPSQGGCANGQCGPSAATATRAMPSQSFGSACANGQCGPSAISSPSFSSMGTSSGSTCAGGQCGPASMGGTTVRSNQPTPIREYDAAGNVTSRVTRIGAQDVPPDATHYTFDSSGTAIFSSSGGNAAAAAPAPAPGHGSPEAAANGRPVAAETSADRKVATAVVDELRTELSASTDEATFNRAIVKALRKVPAGSCGTFEAINQALQDFDRLAKVEATILSKER